MADFGKRDEADPAGFEFFVAGEFFHDGGGGDGSGQRERQVEMAERGEDFFRSGGREGGVFFGKEQRGTDA